MAIWEKYVKNCPQIMFQKVCQTARSQNSLEMASNLVELLHDAIVTRGAQGIAYSCLLDVLSQREQYAVGMERLHEAMRRGVKLEDVNRTALLRLKVGVEEQLELQFPYEVPKKTNDKNRSESPALE
jgi:leucine-rich PPR motif-containing protein